PVVMGTSGSQQVTCAQSVNVTAAPPPQFLLTVQKEGTGSGEVTSSPAGIDCGATCSASYPQGTKVSLTAQADPGSTFAGWSGPCSGGGATCVATMDQSKTVRAKFEQPGFTLRLSKKTPVGLPLGRAVSTPPGIDCALLCTSQSASFPGGTVVTLTAQATVTGTFKGWTGDCSGDGPCVLTMDADKRVTAHFSPLPGGNASSS